jgi:hypothetical protein
LRLFVAFQSQRQYAHTYAAFSERDCGVASYIGACNNSIKPTLRTDISARIKDQVKGLLKLYLACFFSKNLFAKVQFEVLFKKYTNQHWKLKLLKNYF